MKAIITRADDCASSHAANEAILAAAEAGFVKNVSVMACGEQLEEAAEMLAGRKDICFGLHACINSEWDKVIWGPVAPPDMVPSLIDSRGVFYQSPQHFKTHMPVVEEAITEYRYQLEKARRVGFDVKYIDSHMFPELVIPRLQEAMKRLAEEEGLVDHAWFNKILPGNDRFTREQGLFEKTLSEMDGQYLMVMHPARYGEEMRLTGNAEADGELVAGMRELDYRFLTNPELLRLCSAYGVKLLRYDEAQKDGGRYGFCPEDLC